MHSNLLEFALKVFTGFFAIMNPIANIPIFLSFVEGADKQIAQRINKRATITAFLIVFSFVVAGRIIFQLFGITIPAFKITGGLLVFYVGFEMLQSKKSSVKHLQQTNIDEDIAISPLATPILAGPGTIVTAMDFVTKGNLFHMAMVIGIFAIMCLLTYWAFSAGEWILKKLGNNIIAVFGKIMGLIIAIIGTGMVIDGIKMAFNI